MTTETSGGNQGHHSPDARGHPTGPLRVRVAHFASRGSQTTRTGGEKRCLTSMSIKAGSRASA